MALTKDFRETVQARSSTRPEISPRLLRDAIEALLAGESALGANSADYINATVGFPTLAEKTGLHVKSSIRCSGQKAIQPPQIYFKYCVPATT